MPRARGKRMQVSEHDKIARTVAERERTGRSTATAERLAKVGLEGLEHTPADVQRVLEAPLDRMWKASLLSRDEFDAGDTFRTDAYLAAADVAAPGVNWAALGGGFGPRVPGHLLSSAVDVVRARIAWQKVRAALHPSDVFTVLHLALVRELSLSELGESLGYRGKDRFSAAKTALKMALGVLAKYYRGTP